MHSYRLLPGVPRIVHVVVLSLGHIDFNTVLIICVHTKVVQLIFVFFYQRKYTPYPSQYMTHFNKLRKQMQSACTRLMQFMEYYEVSTRANYLITFSFVR